MSTVVQPERPFRLRTLFRFPPLSHIPFLLLVCCSAVHKWCMYGCVLTPDTCDLTKSSLKVAFALRLVISLELTKKAYLFMASAIGYDEPIIKFVCPFVLCPIIKVHVQ